MNHYFNLNYSIIFEHGGLIPYTMVVKTPGKNPSIIMPVGNSTPPSKNAVSANLKRSRYFH